MAVRKNRAMGFVDAALEGFGSTKSAALLERLDDATPWNKLTPPIARLPEYARDNPGRPAWDPVVMLKRLMLAKWFNLSDPGLEEALKDRIIFKRFVGLSFIDEIPDETTFVRFRARLREANIHDKPFDAVVAHIESQGLLVREGTMVDATIIEQPTGRKRDDGTSTCDEDASFTRKHGKTHHGYKGHFACDLSGIVTDYHLTTVKEHDSRRIDELTKTERTTAYADSADSDHARRADLRDRGVIDGIIYKRKRGQAELRDWQKRWNKLVSCLHARVEHPFGMLKQQLCYRRVRYRGRARSEFDFALTMAACNLKRSLSLGEP